MRPIKTKPVLRRYGVWWVLLLFLTIGFSSLSAQGASSIAQGFKTDDPNVVSGAIVSLKKATPNTVELATADKTDQMLGIAGTDSLIELSGSNGSTVQIITNGNATALVSDMNGAVKTGDKITASPIAGVGMKATESVLIIGTAQANLSAADTKTRTITDKKGNRQTVHIGAIPLQVDKVFYEPPQFQDSFLPSALQDFANNLAGRPVSPVRVLIAGFLVIFLFTTVIALLYSSVRSSIVSIGRNPLSEVAVHKSLMQVGITVLGVMIFTVVVIYLILTT